jgi:hypothetical protein
MNEAEQTLLSLVKKGAKSQQIKQILTGTAKNVRENLCDVEREDAPTINDVRLNAIDDNLETFFTIYPKENSNVIIGIIENLKTEGVILRCSEVEKVKAKFGNQTMQFNADGFVFNDGNNGGLTNTPKLKAQLDKLTARVDTIINALQNSQTAAQDGGLSYKTGITAILSTISNKENFAQIEDNNVKH